MTRYRYDKEMDEVVEIRSGSNYFEEKVETTAVIPDTLPGGVNGLFNHATSKSYDSKSRYYRDTRAAGCEIIGNDKPQRRQRQNADASLAGMGQDIKNTIDKIRGEHPATMQGLMRERETIARQNYERRNGN